MTGSDTRSWLRCSSIVALCSPERHSWESIGMLRLCASSLQGGVSNRRQERPRRKESVMAASPHVGSDPRRRELKGQWSGETRVLRKQTCYNSQDWGCDPGSSVASEDHGAPQECLRGSVDRGRRGGSPWRVCHWTGCDLLPLRAHCSPTDLSFPYLWGICSNTFHCKATPKLPEAAFELCNIHASPECRP